MDNSAIQEWIGRTTQAEDLVSPRLLASYHATLDPHLAPTAVDEAPPGLHWCLAPEIRPLQELGIDGHPERGDFLSPILLPNRMWAGGELEILGCIRSGDRVSKVSTVDDIAFKQGRSGPLCFVAVKHDYAVEGKVVVKERHDIMYRERQILREDRTASSSTATIALTPQASAEEVRRIEASSVLLFRYSALTFNGHRIHYDQPYATQSENYDGLVIHGPLQATLLLNLATVIHSQTPRKFSYRGVGPLIAPNIFEVCGQSGANETRCWTRDMSGRIGMTATAIY